MGIIGPSAPTGPAGGSLSGTYPNPGLAAATVTGANIAANTIGSANYEAESVRGDKAELPQYGSKAPKVEGEVVSATFLGTLKVNVIALTAKAEATQKKIKHFLKVAAGGPVENIFVLGVYNVKATEKVTGVGAVSLTGYTWKLENIEEFELTLTAAPTAKDVLWIMVGA